MSASVSVTRHVKQMHTKCEQLIASLEGIAGIESSEQHAMRLKDVKVLVEMMPSRSRELVDLMANHCSEIDGFASETFGMLLSEIIKKFKESHDDVPVEIVKLFEITDHADFILETMNVLSDAKLIDQSPQLIVKLLEKLIRDESYLIFAFTRLSNSQHDLKINDYIQHLISLPDKIANKLQHEFPCVFNRRTFSAILLHNVIKSLHIMCTINKLEQLKVYNMKFLSRLISRVFVHFKSDKTLLVNVLRLMSSMSESAIYGESIRGLAIGLQRQAVEIVAQHLFASEEKVQRLVGMLGDVWRSNSDWSFVLTKKIPLLSFCNDDRIIANLSFFLATEDSEATKQLLMEMLMVWSTKSHVIDSPFEQHFYVSKFIVLLTKYLPNPKDNAENIKRLLFNGMQIHIGSSDKKLQALGMITAETVLGIVNNDAKDEEKLKFDYSAMDAEIVREIVDVIREFPERALDAKSLLDGDDDTEKLMEKLSQIADNREEITQVTKKKTALIVQKPVDPVIIQQAPIELDSDDDDLQPYPDNPNDHQPNSDSKRPKYLLDLIQNFTIKENFEDPEKFELSVMSAEVIIKQQLPSHHTDIAIDLLRIFITLDKSCYMENFEELKMKILIQICCIYPKDSAEYLCQEFNTEASKYAISRRMLMLEVLTETAKTLSKLEMPKSNEPQSTSAALSSQKQNKLLIKLHEELENRNRKDAQKIIRERLMAKTRRIVTRTKAPDESAGINRFAEVAGWFFFPLIHGFGRKQMVFKVGTNLRDDVDNLLMIKFLQTISVLMLCAENSVVAPKMAKELMNLSVFLRYHEESQIRLAVLHMVATIILAVPRKVLINEFAQEIGEFINHLGKVVQSTVVSYEPDKECREFAQQLLGMFQGISCAE